MELFSKIVAHDENMVVFGTDAAEFFVGWEALNESMQRQFDASENVKITSKELSIKVNK